jgi:hypothetical protein
MTKHSDPDPDPYSDPHSPARRLLRRAGLAAGGTALAGVAATAVITAGVSIDGYGTASTHGTARSTSNGSLSDGTAPGPAGIDNGPAVDPHSHAGLSGVGQNQAPQARSNGS